MKWSLTQSQQSVARITRVDLPVPSLSSDEHSRKEPRCRFPAHTTSRLLYCWLEQNWMPNTLRSFAPQVKDCSSSLVPHQCSIRGYFFNFISSVHNYILSRSSSAFGVSWHPLQYLSLMLYGLIRFGWPCFWQCVVWSEKVSVGKRERERSAVTVTSSFCSSLDCCLFGDGLVLIGCGFHLT